MREGLRPIDAAETPDAIKAEGVDYLTDQTGYQPADGDPLDGDLAHTADEAALLWAAVRALETDTYRDFGSNVLGVPDPQPSPASSTIAVTALPGTDGAADRTLEAGETLVLHGTSGDYPLVVVADATIPAGQTTVAGVVVETPGELGATPNGQGAGATTADGTIDLDAPPVWLASVMLEAPLAGGQDARGDDEQLAVIKLAVLLQQTTPTHLDDLELAARTVPGCYRMLAVKGLDVRTGQTGLAAIASGFPIDEDGEPVSAGVGLAVQRACLGDTSRLLCQREMPIGRPTYTRVGAQVRGTTTDPDVDRDQLAADVAAAIAGRLQPGRHALPQPGTGQVVRWLRGRTTIRRYELAAEANLVPSLDEITELTLTGTVLNADGTDGDPAPLDADGNVVMPDPAPLPRPGDITVKIDLVT